MRIRIAHPLRRTILSVLAASVTLAGAAYADEHVVAQAGKAFTTKELAIKVGDTVKFVNNDPFSHNVFSLSPAKNFDLGSYPQGGAKTVVFDKPGAVDVECAIHPNMTMKIEVRK